MVDDLVLYSHPYCKEWDVKGHLEKKNFFSEFKNKKFFWLHQAAGEIVAPQPGIEPTPPELEAQNLNH